MAGLGRSPDHKAAFLATLGANAEFYAPYEENARRLHRCSQQRVPFVSDAIVQPAVDRNTAHGRGRPDRYLHARNQGNRCRDPLQQRLIVGMKGGPHEAVGRTACPSPCTPGWPLRGWHADAGGPLALWRNGSDDVEGCPLNAGHFFPEELPNETTDALNRFFAVASRSQSAASLGGSALHRTTAPGHSSHPSTWRASVSLQRP